MTAQIGDRFKYGETNYTIAKISQPFNFNPREYGITPFGISTACWDGYWCVYNITDEGIFLENLFINSARDYYPAINGVTPKQEEDGSFSYMGHHLYKGINLKIDYTGKILIGDEFLHAFYIHMGCQRPWAYKVLKELVFENGNLIECNELSQVAADIREKIKTGKKISFGMQISPFSVVAPPITHDKKFWWL